MDKPNQAVVSTADEELVNMEQVSQQKHTCRSHIHIKDFLRLPYTKIFILFLTPLACDKVIYTNYFQ